MKQTIHFVSTPTPNIPADVWHEAELYAALGFEEGEIENDGQRYQWEVQKKPVLSLVEGPERAESDHYLR